jgi:hypothetical protein
MAAISVANLQKRFEVRQKAAGLSGSLRALLRPELREVDTTCAAQGGLWRGRIHQGAAKQERRQGDV